MNDEKKPTVASPIKPVVIRPIFMDSPDEYTTRNSSVKYHQYWMPEDGEQIIEAITWMISVYDDVVSEYGESYGCPYCRLVGKVKDL